MKPTPLHLLPKSLHHQTHAAASTDHAVAHQSHTYWNQLTTTHHPSTQNPLPHKSQPTQPNTNLSRSPSLTTAKSHNLHPQTQQKFIKTRLLNSLLGSLILLKLEGSRFVAGKLEGSWFCWLTQRRKNEREKESCRRRKNAETHHCRSRRSRTHHVNLQLNRATMSIRETKKMMTTCVVFPLGWWEFSVEWR